MMTYDIIYKDETDRCYGLTGMAVSMAVFNSEDQILEINIDSAPESIFFSPEFYFSGNPRCSAKVVWGELANHYRLALAMAMGNLLSRRVVLQSGGLSEAEEGGLRDLAIEEGSNVVGLESDEVERLWTKDYEYLKKVFRHPGVQRATKEIALEIQKRRIISRQELLELLSVLNRL